MSIAINKKYKRHIKDWEYINERLLTVNVKIYGRDIMIIAVYAQTDDSPLEIKDEFEATLTDVISNIRCRKEIIMMEDFNGQMDQNKMTTLLVNSERKLRKIMVLD